MATPFRGFSVLVPVPQRHLDSSYEKLKQEPLSCIAFGSGKIKEQTSYRMLRLFESIDKERDGDPVALLIYPSKETDNEKPPYQVCWAAWYVKHVPARGDGLHPDSDPWRYRPPTCKQNYEINPDSERWIMYWHAAGLMRLDEDNWINIQSLERDRPLRPWPLGPEVVQGSSWTSVLDYLKPVQDSYS